MTKKKNLEEDQSVSNESSVISSPNSESIELTPPPPYLSPPDFPPPPPPDFPPPPDLPPPIVYLPEFNENPIYNYFGNITNSLKYRLHQLYMGAHYRTQDGKATPLLTVDQFLSLALYTNNNDLSRKIIDCARYPESYLTKENEVILRVTIEVIDAIRILSQDPRYRIPTIAIGEPLNQVDGSVAPATTHTKQRLIHYAHWGKNQTEAALKDIANGELPNASFLSTSCLPGGAIAFKQALHPDSSDTAITLVIDVDEPCNIAKVGAISVFNEREQEILLAPNVKLFTYQSNGELYDEPIDIDGRTVIHLCARNGNQFLEDIHSSSLVQPSFQQPVTQSEIDEAFPLFDKLSEAAKQNQRPKSTRTHSIEEGTRKLSRVVMRHPSYDVQTQLVHLHKILKESFNQCNVLIVDDINSVTKSRIRNDPSKYIGNYIYDKGSDKLYRVLALDYVNTVDEISAADDLRAAFESVCQGTLPNAGEMISLTYQQINQLEQQAHIEGGIHIDDEAIAWMLGGSSEESRGGFGSLANDEDKAQAIALFRTFLNSPPSGLSSQAFLTKLETLVTAIGYRHIHADFALQPARPQSPSQHAMAQYIDKRIMDHRLSVGVWNTYINRETEALDGANLEVDKLLYPEFIIETNDPEYLSDASDVEDEVKQRKHKTGKRAYKRTKEFGGTESTERSWIGQANAQGIPIRAHTSGTVTLGCAVVDGLYRLDSNGTKTWFDDDVHAKQLSAALFIATYDRGDYHTVAETGAGVDHFLRSRRIIDRILMRDVSAPSSSSLKYLSPQEAFNYSLDCMILSCMDEHSRESQQITLSKPLSLAEVACVQRIGEWLKMKIISDQDPYFENSINMSLIKTVFSLKMRRLNSITPLSEEMTEALIKLNGSLDTSYGQDKLVVKRSEYAVQLEMLNRIVEVMLRIFSELPASEDLNRAYQLLLEEVRKNANREDESIAAQYRVLERTMENLYQKQLVVAAKNYNRSAMQYFILNNADISQKDENGRTPIFYAVFYIDLAIIKLLLEHGASVNVKDSQGNTPLDYAKLFNYTAIIQFLRENEAEESTSIEALPDTDIEDLSDTDIEELDTDIEELDTEEFQTSDKDESDGKKALTKELKEKLTKIINDEEGSYSDESKPKI